MRLPPRRLLLGALLALIPELGAVHGQVTELDEWLTPDPDEPRAILRLYTDEVLRGRAEYMNYGELHFNSDKFDKIKLDWSDIRYFATSEILEYVIRGNVRYRGLGRATSEQVWVTDADGTETTFPRDELLAIFPGEERLGGGRWFGNIGVSFETTSGNAEDTSFDLFARSTVRLGSGELILNANSSYAESNKQETRKKNGVFAQGNIELSDWLYVTPGRVEANYDKFQNIALRLRLGAGAGINLIRTNDLNWRLEGGGGYDYTEYRRVDVGEDDTEGQPVVYISAIYERDVTRYLELSLRVDSYVGTDNPAEWTLDFTGEVSYDLFKDVELDFRVVLEHFQSPERLSDGTLPERNDIRFLIGLSWEF